jgi:WD40 repeat protein
LLNLDDLPSSRTFDKGRRTSSVAFSPEGRWLVSSAGDTLKVWEATSGGLLTTFSLQSGLWAATISGGRSLVAASSLDGTVTVWPVCPPTVHMADQETLWDDLMGGDVAAAYAATSWLLSTPSQTVALIRKKIPATSFADVMPLRRDLDDDDIAVREKATQRLLGLAAITSSSARRAAAEAESPEVRSRLLRIAEKKPNDRVAPEIILHSRVVTILAHLGTSDAVDQLKAYAGASDLLSIAQESKRAVAWADAHAGPRAGHAKGDRP